MKKEINRLPFVETVARSFKYVFKNRELQKAMLPVIAGLFVAQLIFGMPLLCSYSSEYCQGKWNFLNLLIILVCATGIIINYCRSIICKENSDYISKAFWKRVCLYLLVSFSLSTIIALATMLLVVPVGYISTSETMVVVFTAIITIIISIMLAPIFLIFPAIAVDNKEMINIKKVYAMAKNNFNAIFWGQFVIMIPFWLLNQMAIELYALLGNPNYFMKVLFLALATFLSVIDACFKGAFFAHIYQFFTFYDKHQKEE